MDFTRLTDKSQKTDYYKVLNCTRENSVEQIHHEYKRLCLLHHPDKIRSSTISDPEVAPTTTSTSQFQLIQEAYEVVSGHNQELLKEYFNYLDSDLLVPFHAWQERKREHGHTVMHWHSTPHETVKKLEAPKQETKKVEEPKSTAVDSDELYRKFRNYET